MEVWFGATESYRRYCFLAKVSRVWSLSEASSLKWIALSKKEPAIRGIALWMVLFCLMLSKCANSE
jgi:hypothetical protein